MDVKETFTEHIGVRVTPSFHQQIKHFARKTGLPTAIFIRQILYLKIDELVHQEKEARSQG